MQTIRGAQNTTAVMTEALTAALARVIQDQTHGAGAPALTLAWQTLIRQLERSMLTPRQRELVLWDMLGLRRAQIAEIMGVTPTTLTTYWKAIYARYDVGGADARAALHARLFPR